MRHVSAEEYLQDLANQKLIYPVDWPRSKHGSWLSGSRHPCRGVMSTSSERSDSEDFEGIAKRVSNLSRDTIRDRSRRIECECTEIGETSELESRIKYLREKKKEIEESADQNRYSSRELRELGNEIERLESKRSICKYEDTPAWYVSYRYDRRDWGIHISEFLLYLYTESIFGNIYPKYHRVAPAECMGALHSTLEHEIYHMCFNVFMDKCEKVLDAYQISNFEKATLYLIYIEKVYARQYDNPTGAREEGLASSWEFEAFADYLSSSKHRWNTDFQAIIDNYWKVMRNRSPGYRDIHRYCNKDGIQQNQMTRECLNLVQYALNADHGLNLDGKEIVNSMKGILKNLIPKRFQLSSVSIPLWIHP